jgi:FixJ family two-component response regulator
MQNNKPTIHVVDDDPDTRKYLKDLISTINFNTKVYDSATNFLETYQEDGLGCLILDLRMPGINGLDLQTQLASNHIDLPVIMISGYGDIATAVKAMKAGVLDFIEKPFRGKFMLERIQNAVLHHENTRNQKEVSDDILKLAQSLTKREKEVMDLVVLGKQNKDIAIDLGISIKTVEVHRANVMAKMKVNSVADLVRMSLLINANK